MNRNIFNYEQFVSESKSRKVVPAIGGFGDMYDQGLDIVYIEKEINISESNNTFGDEMEHLYNTDEDAKIIINEYIEGSDPTLRIANIINLLDDKEKNNLRRSIDNYLQNGLADDIKISTSVLVEKKIFENQQPNVETEITSAGKNIFNSFTKIITALGLKDNDPYEPCPQNFILFYHYENIESQTLIDIFNRYKSLTPYTEYIKDGSELYFGIRTDGYIEYGIAYDNSEVMYKIGEFRITANSLKWILVLKTKSINSLKKYLIDLTGKNIKMIGQIKKDMYDFKPGNFGGRKYTIDKGIITFEYFGLDINNIQSLKQDFNKYILSKSWKKKVLTKVSTDNMKVYYSIKLK